MNLTCSQIAKAAGLKFDKKIGRQIIYYCPNHDDHNGSLNLNIDKNVWICGPCGKSGGAWALAFFLSGYSRKNDVIQWLIERNLVEDNNMVKSKPVAIYIYRDAEGKEVYQVKKYINSDGKKGFAQFHKEGNDWKPGMSGVQLYPYRLNEWIDKPVVYIVEGEKDVDNLWNWGIPATTNPQGAGSWREEYNGYFRGKRVVIFPDNDEVGLSHAKDVLANLIKIATSVKIVSIPGLPPKGDFSDWVTKYHGTKAELFKHVLDTPWATLEDSGITSDAEAEVGMLIRRMSYDVSDLFAQEIECKEDLDAVWMWMKDNNELWDRIQETETRLNESCLAKDPAHIVMARCLEWKVAFKNAIIAFLKWNKEAK